MGPWYSLTSFHWTLVHTATSQRGEAGRGWGPGTALPHSIGLWYILPPAKKGRQGEEEAPDPGKNNEAQNHVSIVKSTLKKTRL